MDPNLYLISLFAFAAAALFCVAVYLAWGDILGIQRDWFTRRLGDETAEEKRQRLGATMPAFKDLGKLPTNPFDDDSVPQTWYEQFQAAISQADLPLTPEAVLIRSALLGLSLGGLVWMGTSSVLAALMVALVAASFPVLHVVAKRHHRLERMRFQLPDVFELMARVIRAGQTTSQAMLAVTEEFAEPVKGEFLTCYQQQNMGLPAEAALRDMARRTGLLEVRMFVVATIVQWQTGGNLSEALEELSQVIRDRFRIRSLIRTITAEGRFQAGVLLALPAFLFFMIAFLNWDYAKVLLDHPNVLLMGLVAEFLGAIWIRRIINFDF